MEQVLQPNIDYRAIFCTDSGAVYIDLYESVAPSTVNNFVFLAQNGYYNNTIFHRVIPNFMAQGGDPTGTGSGGPGYQFADEYPWFVTFDRPGLLAMANSGPNTNGSQFFITTVPTPHLNYAPVGGALRGHTIFGAVLQGQENVSAFLVRDPQDPAQQNNPTTQLQTVLIVTDPRTVETTFMPAATIDPSLIINSLQELEAQANEDFGVEVSPLLAAEETANAAPEAFRSSLLTGLQSFNFSQGAFVRVNNTNCNLAFNYTSTSYRLYGFTSANDARAALTDGLFTRLAEAEGLTQSTETALGVPVFTADVQACNVNARTGRIYVQRGRYVGAMEITIPADVPFTLTDALEQLTSRIFETTLAPVLVPELTQ
ncbi:MAG: peptidylprolyl isomerase [Anaerolineae bacterium]|nr:peptidylprolyl isomerase [Anaerolineae bacterium]